MSGYNEPTPAFELDTQYQSTDDGVPSLVVRNDSDESLVDSDKDYTFMQTDDFGRLKVVNHPRMGLDLVFEYAPIASGRNKINYTVPVGKKLSIKQWHVSISEGKEYIMELQKDGTPIDSIGSGEDGGPGNHVTFADGYEPIFPEGTVIRVRREVGDSGKDWSAGFIGHLIDA